MNWLSNSNFNFEQGDVILINKPYSLTSFGMVQKLKSMLKPFYNEYCNQKILQGIKKDQIPKLKIGHAGTLDPLATGLLVICTGKKTKIISEIQEMDKTYEGIFVLGATTPSYDLEKQPDQFYPTKHITREKILEVAKTFEGEIYQTPPVFSAVKVQGDRAYELARKGEVPELNAKKIRIYSFEILEWKDKEVRFILKCSKGTYVRALARDFGEALKSGAYLKQLKRTQIGIYSLSNAVDLEFSAKDKQAIGVKFHEDKEKYRK